MKKNILKFIPIFIMIFTLTACGASTPDTPSAVVDKNFKSLKSQEDKTYKEFREGFFQSINLDPKKSDDSSKLADKFIEQLMKFEYKIGKETVKGKEAKVEIEVKTYDFKKIIASIKTELTEKITKKELNVSSQEEVMKVVLSSFISHLKSEKMETKATATVTLKKTGDNWVLENSVENQKEIANAIMGDFFNSGGM